MILEYKVIITDSKILNCGIHDRNISLQKERR